MGELIALVYHDVLCQPGLSASGFRGADAEHYKLTAADFVQQLSVIAASPLLARDDSMAIRTKGTHPSGLCLTFDDGGASSLDPTADLLESHGLRGQFFVPTDFVDSPGFATGAELRELVSRGHVVGVHSASHPIPITYLSPAAIKDEWVRSKAALEQVLGLPVRSGSVPGGFTSALVEQLAQEAGLTLLFTSEPTRRIRSFGEMRIAGRFSVTRSTSLAQVRALTEGRWSVLARQAVLWEAKKIAKRIGGKYWLAARRRFFAR